MVLNLKLEEGYIMRIDKDLVKYIKEEHRIKQRTGEIISMIEKAREEGRLGLLSHLRNTIDVLNNSLYQLDSKYPKYKNVFLTTEQIEQILNMEG